jgi:D-alanine transaminase
MKQIVYLNNSFIDSETACISPNDRGFLFSDGVYEVVRCYNGHRFELERHLDRLQYGLRELRISDIDRQHLSDVSSELLRVNNIEQGEALIYLQVTRGAAKRTHYFPPADTPQTVFASASRFRHPVGERENGVRVILVPDTRWARCDIKSIALLPNVLARQQAVENEAAEALFVRDGFVMEGSHCNFCAVFDGAIITPPATNYILAGITRQVVIELCKKMNITCHEQPIQLTNLNKADEIMIVGTTVEITPVTKVDEWTVGNGKPGPITRNIQQAFKEMTSRR